MGYCFKEMEAGEAYQKINEYRYALIYMISDIAFGKTEELELPDWEECQEARFFSEDQELHIFELDGEKTAVEIVDDGAEEDVCDKKFQLDKRFSGDGNLLCVREYLAYDEDGQVFVKLTRLKGIE